MSKEERQAKMDEINAKMKELEAKTKDSIDTAKLKAMYAKDKVDEMASESKGNINALKENLRLLGERVKGKASSELIKAQMNIDVAKEKLTAKKEAHDKAAYEAYIDDVIDYASVCIELSMLAAEEARLAVLEALEAEQEYEEKYGSEE